MAKRLIDKLMESKKNSQVRNKKVTIMLTESEYEKLNRLSIFSSISKQDLILEAMQLEGLFESVGVVGNSDTEFQKKDVKKEGVVDV